MTEQEFAHIVHRTKKTVLAAITRFLPAEYSHAIDDIAQETYLRAYKGIITNRYVDEGHLNAWLYSIAKHETLRMLKKLKNYSACEIVIKQTDDAHEEQSLDIAHYLKKLPSKYRPVITLAIEGYSDQEISQKLSIPIGTVKSRKFRAKEMLYKILRKGGF